MTSKDAPHQFVTDDEVNALILATIDYHGDATMEELEKVVEWAEGVRIDAAVLSLVLAGEVVVSPRDGEIRWRSRSP